MPKIPAKKRSPLDIHVNRIQAALARTRDAFFDVVIAIKAARDELNDDLFQRELAARLSMSPSTLSKYLRIADCTPLLKYQKLLPPTLTTLYDLTKLHGSMTKAYGESDGHKRFDELLLSKKIGPATEAREIAPLIQKVKLKAVAVAKRKREKAILTLAHEVIAPKAVSSFKTMDELLASKIVFRTILMTPPNDLLRKWNDDGFFSNQVAEAYPIAELRAPSQSETVQGFVYCPTELITAGLKLLSASGFTFRDIFVPYQSSEGLARFTTEKLLLRGERGHPLSFSPGEPTRDDIEGVFDVANALGEPPRLLVFADDVIEEWTCVKSEAD